MANVCPACECSTSFSKNPEREDPDISEAEKERLPEFICDSCSATFSYFLKE